MKIFVALAMGFLSSFVIYMMGSLAFLDLYTPVNIRITFTAVSLIGGWVASSYLLWRGAEKITNVLSRGFLLGASEWLLMIGVGFIQAGKAVDLTGANTETSIVSGGIIATVMGGFSLFMILVCLAGFAIVYFWKRERSISI